MIFIIDKINKQTKIRKFIRKIRKKQRKKKERKKEKKRKEKKDIKRKKNTFLYLLTTLKRSGVLCTG